VTEPRFGEKSTVHATSPLSEEATVRYVIDDKASSFFVKVFSAGLLSAFAHSPRVAIRDFQGNASFNPAGGLLDHAQLSLTIQASSLVVVDDISQKDRDEIHERMYNEVLEVDRYPEIVYECTRVTASGTGDRYWAALRGELSLHGVTNPLPISAKLVVNGDSLRASGEFSIKQTDYGIKLVSAAGGSIRVKDELKLTFDVLARRQ
jgi:polyisoprenoid-binding protein YceI